MLVKRLHALSGHDILLKPGDHIDVPTKVGREWIEKGLAAEPDKGAAAGDNLQDLKRAVQSTKDENARLLARVAELESQLAAGARQSLV